MFSSNFNFGKAEVHGSAIFGDYGTIKVQHDFTHRQVLVELAAKIQLLLRQLEKNKPAATENEKIAYVNNELPFTFRSRVVNALQAGSETAIEEFLDNPYVNVGKAIVKGWVKSE